MNQQTKERIFTLVMVFGILLVLLVGIFIIVYYFKFAECPCITEENLKINFSQLNFS